MRQRPIAYLALLVFLILTALPKGLFYRPRELTQKSSAQIVGEVARYTYKNEKTQLDLRDCQIQSGDLIFREDHLLVYLTGAAEYPAGTVLSLSGTIYPTEDPTNPGQFDSRLYYAGKGISYTVYAERAEVTGQRARPLREGLLVFQRRVGQVYDTVCGQRESGILKAMVLGEKSDLDADVKELYQKNGISHLLAISGLHISLLGMGLYRLLKRLGASRLAAGLPTIALLAAYGWMTGASVSAIRAAAMCALLVAAELLGRTYDLPTAVGAVALVFMLTNPLSVKQSAFLLSFGAVLGIGLFSPVLKLYCPKPGKLTQALWTGASVLLFTFPLVLTFFSDYPLYSTFLNLLVIPLMSVLMVCGLLCGLSGLLSLRVARLFALPCHLILGLYERIGTLCLSLPGAVLHIGAPPVWKLAAYYLALAVVLLLLYREKRRKKYWRGRGEFHPGKMAPAIGSILMGLMIALLCLRIHTGFSITMLDVGQGDGIFLRAPDGTTFLCDGGSSNVSGVGTYRILPFLKSEGVGTLDYVMISHMDSDHISGIQELVEQSMEPGGVKIAHAVLPVLEEPDEAYVQMVQLFAEAEVEILYMGRGDSLNGTDYSLTCLAPAHGAAIDDRNEQSLVLLAEYGEFQMFLTGDIGEETENELAASGLLQGVEVLKVAHHGSRYSTTEAFLEETEPLLAVISCSATNTYGHPGEETLERLRQAGSQVLITKDCGAIRIWTDGQTVRAKGYVEGWQPE